MRKEFLPYILIMAVGVFISSVSQVLLKKAASKEYKNHFLEYLNIRVIIAYALFFCATLLSVFAYKVLPLSMGPIIESTGYIYVAIFGVTIFNEKLSKKKIMSLVLIVVGIVIYALSAG